MDSNSQQDSVEFDFEEVVRLINQDLDQDPFVISLRYQMEALARGTVDTAAIGDLFAQLQISDEKDLAKQLGVDQDDEDQMAKLTEMMKVVALQAQEQEAGDEVAPTTEESDDWSNVYFVDQEEADFYAKMAEELWPLGADMPLGMGEDVEKGEIEDFMMDI